MPGPQYIVTGGYPLLYVQGGLNDTIVNVKDYGALGDGVTDDTLSIQAAVNASCAAHGICYFPYGSYIITSAINCISGGWAAYIVGDNKVATYVRVRGTTGTDGLVWSPGAQYVAGGGLTGLTVASDTPFTTSRNLVVVNNMAYYNLNNVQITGAGNNCLLTGGGIQNLFADSLFENSGSDVCYVGWATSGGLGTTTRFRDVYFHAGGGRGCNVQYDQIDVQFDDCIFESNGWNQSIATTLVGVNTLPSSTVNVASTTGWPSSGAFYIPSIPTAIATYTGTTPTSFTGCVASNASWTSVYPNAAPAGESVTFINQATGQGIYVVSGVVTLNAPYFENNASYAGWFGDYTLTNSLPYYLWGVTVTVENPFYNLGAFCNYYQNTVFFDGWCTGSSQIGGQFFGGVLAGTYCAEVHPTAQVTFVSYPPFYYYNGSKTGVALPQTPDGNFVHQLAINNGLFRGQQFSILETMFSPGLISAGGYLSQTYNIVSANGASTDPNTQPVVGDIVSVGYVDGSGNPLPIGIILVGDIVQPWTSVGSPSQVRVTAFNFTSGSVTLNYGNLRIDILKHTVGTGN